MLSYALGQLLAVDLAIIPLLAHWLGQIKFPGAIAQVGLGYFWLSMLVFYVRPWKHGLSHPIYLYFLVGLLDFEGNFCISEAFGLIPPIIARFLLNLSLPVGVLLDVFHSGKVPTLTQLLGLMAVVAGVVLAVLSPLTLAGERDRTQATKGVLYALASTVLGALSGLAQNFLMKQEGKQVEMIACMSLAAVVAAAIQLPLWERERYTLLPKPALALVGIVSISFLIFIFYIGSVLFKRKYPQALPLNLLTINGYVFLGELVFFKNWDALEPLLGGALVLTIGGALVYHLEARRSEEADDSLKPGAEEVPLLDEN